MKKLSFILGLPLFLGIAACSGDGSISSSDDVPEGFDVEVAEVDELPVCDEDRDGFVAYVSEDDVKYVCADGDWNVAESSSSEKDLSSSSSNKVAVKGIKDKTIKGVCQKGPFEKGSKVVIYELDSKTFEKTGKKYSGKVKSDKGDYSIDGVTFDSPFASVEVRGRFISESSPMLMDTVTLKALVDLSERKTVNVNILTHMDYEYRKKAAVATGRVETDEFRKMVLDAFYLDDSLGSFEDLSIFGDGYDNAALLAVSAIVHVIVESQAFYGKTWRLYLEEGHEREGYYYLLNDEEKIANISLGLMSGQIRNNLEHFDMGVVPKFEDVARKIWESFYNLGDCGKKTKGKIEKRWTVFDTNDLSSGNLAFKCMNGEWETLYGFDADTAGLGKGEDGDIVNAFSDLGKKLVYDGEKNSWRYMDYYERIYGLCTKEVEAGDDWYKIDENRSVVCANRNWEYVTNEELDTLRFGVGKNGEQRNGRVTDRALVYDSVLTEWRYLTGVEINYGFCSEEIHADEFKNLQMDNETEIIWWYCDGRNWIDLSKSEADTIGFGAGIDGEQRDGLVTASMYVYEEATQSWRYAEEMEYDMSSCTIKREGLVEMNVFDEVYYTCRDNLWEIASQEEYDTYQNPCTEENEGTTIYGNVNTSVQYQCNDGEWVVLD